MTTHLRTRGFHHATLVANDAPRTLAFYGELLGLGLVKKTVNFDDPSAYHLYFGDETGRPGSILTFFEWRNAPRGAWGVGGVHHIALGVGTTEAQLKWKRRLTDAGVAVDGPLDRGYFRSMYFSDPDGQVIEIATRGPGYAIDEAADALGQSLLTPPKERMPEGSDTVAIQTATHPEPVSEVTPDMKLEGIHHVSAITDDLALAGEFYEQALGLRLVKQTYNQDDSKTKHFFWAAYEDGVVEPNSSMTLFGWEGSKYVSRAGAGQTHHIAFRAADRGQQDAWRDHLLAMGLSVSPIMDRTYFESIYFRAPDGLLVEIATDGPGFLVDEPAESLGETLKLPAWLEPRRDSIEQTLVPLR